MRWEAFHKGDWQDLIARLSQLTGLPAPTIDWDRLPALPSRMWFEIGRAGNLRAPRAEAEGSPLRARQIEIAERDDPFEFMFDQGLTDGLPVIPPTPDGSS